MKFERITINPKQMGGLPCIRGLRIPVTTVLGQLAAGRTHEQILEDFPEFEEADIYAALEFGDQRLGQRQRASPDRSSAAPRSASPLEVAAAARRGQRLVSRSIRRRVSPNNSPRRSPVNAARSTRAR